MPRDDYRQNAAQCLRLAHQARDVRAKFIMLEMAQAWMRLAEHSEKLRGWIGSLGDLPAPNQPTRRA
jgi:hypothetical protein